MPIQSQKDTFLSSAIQEVSKSLIQIKWNSKSGKKVVQWQPRMPNEVNEPMSMKKLIIPRKRDKRLLDSKFIELYLAFHAEGKKDFISMEYRSCEGYVFGLAKFKFDRI